MKPKMGRDAWEEPWGHLVDGDIGWAAGNRSVCVFLNLSHYTFKMGPFIDSMQIVP